MSMLMCCMMILLDCSITNYKKFVKKVNNSLQWSHELEELKTASRNVLNDWRVVLLMVI